jgi:hypothetical protein
MIGPAGRRPRLVPLLEAKQIRLLSFVVFMSNRLVRRWWSNLHSQFFRMLQVRRIKSAFLRSWPATAKSDNYVGNLCSSGPQPPLQALASLCRFLPIVCQIWWWCGVLELDSSPSRDAIVEIRTLSTNVKELLHATYTRHKTLSRLLARCPSGYRIRNYPCCVPECAEYAGSILRVQVLAMRIRVVMERLLKCRLTTRRRKQEL